MGRVNGRGYVSWGGGWGVDWVCLQSLGQLQLYVCWWAAARLGGCSVAVGYLGSWVFQVVCWTQALGYCWRCVVSMWFSVYLDS